MENAKNKQIGFQLINIATEQFAIIQDAFDKSIKEITFSVNIDFGVNKEERVIASVVKIQFEQKKSTFLIIEISNHYNIEQSGWDEMNTDDKNKIIIPKDFATHLLVLTIGTLRGVLHAKTENTEFNQFVLPTLNISELIQSDIELTL